MKEEDVVAEVAKLIRTIPDADQAARVVVQFVRANRVRGVGKSVDPKPGKTLLVFPTVGTKKEWPYTTGEQEDLDAMYPTLDVWDNVRRARAWIEANHTRRKTYGGMRRFLVGWLNREANSAKKAADKATRSRTKLDDDAAKTDKYLAEQQEAAEQAALSWEGK